MCVLTSKESGVAERRNCLIDRPFRLDQTQQIVDSLRNHRRIPEQRYRHKCEQEREQVGCDCLRNV
jgi:hypothetical protein